MIIKHTQKKGLSVQTKTAEAILEADKLIIQSEDRDEPFVITTPGEYEVSGIAVFSFDPTPTFVIEADHITVVYMPNPTTEKFEDNVMTELQRVDILLIPGKRADLVSQLAPYLVIPLNDSEELAKALKKDLPEPVKSLNIKSHSELPEETEIVILAGS